MTRALDNRTVTASMHADYIALVQRMVAFITKQESDARGWIKDPKQLESALVALAERKATAQKVVPALTEKK